MYSEVFSSSSGIEIVIALVVVISLIMFICTPLRLIKYLFKMPKYLWPHLCSASVRNQGILGF